MNKSRQHELLRWLRQQRHAGDKKGDQKWPPQCNYDQIINNLLIVFNQTIQITVIKRLRMNKSRQHELLRWLRQQRHHGARSLRLASPVVQRGAQCEAQQ
jgi:phage antirepressor YoqD-like protein